MRKILFFPLIALFGIFAQLTIGADNNTKVVCYYDSRSFLKEGLGKVTLADLEPALSQCTYLVYGYAGINEQTKKLVSLNENQDLDQGKGLYRVATSLKRKFPGLKVLLSVGGDAEYKPDKYLELLESSANRMAFINSAYAMVKTYDFDGLDLAFEFPKIKPKKIRSGIGSVWSSFKKKIGVGGDPVDPKADEHREEFTILVREIKNAFRYDGYQLSLTVLPNVNSSHYFDVPSIVSYFDYINVNAFDFQTPVRNPKEADYAAPIYAPSERNPEFNVDYQVNNLLQRGVPATKIVLGIPTFARVWKIEEDATLTGVPPVTAVGGADEGIQSKEAGLYSYPEVCGKLTNPSNKDLKGENGPIRKVGDPSKRFGSYGYRVDKDFGLWLSYEDPDSAGNKAGYIRAKGMGGIALMDLSKDDFRGACGGPKYPILTSARNRLI
jgi:GH18 family chitinase